MKHILNLTAFGLFMSIMILPFAGHSQLLENADSYTVDQIYKKVELDYGTLDENGNEIDYIFVKTDIKAGTYKIDLTDGPGDLYEIMDTDYYISFVGYFGYAGYDTQCVLKIKGGYSSPIVYKME